MVRMALEAPHLGRQPLSNPKNPRKGYEKVFDTDEMNLVQPHESWSRETLLATEGIFLLKDVAVKLNLDSGIGFPRYR